MAKSIREYLKSFFPNNIEIPKEVENNEYEEKMIVEAKKTRTKIFNFYKDVLEKINTELVEGGDVKNVIEINTSDEVLKHLNEIVLNCTNCIEKVECITDGKMVEDKKMIKMLEKNVINAYQYCKLLKRNLRYAAGLDETSGETELKRIAEKESGESKEYYEKILKDIKDKRVKHKDGVAIPVPETETNGSKVQELVEKQLEYVKGFIDPEYQKKKEKEDAIVVLKSKEKDDPWEK